MKRRPHLKPMTEAERELAHAGKVVDLEGLDWIRRTFPSTPLPAEFECGGIVGRARLIDCVISHPSPFFFGPYGFIMAEAEPLPFLPCRGQLGFFKPRIVARSALGL